jgi:hypothetical protein
MSCKHIGRAGMCAGTMMLLALPVLAQTAASSGQNKNESQETGRLLRDVRSDAMQVRSAAAQWEHLTTSSDAKWVEYDRQWNEIKPAVEDMQMKLARLETMHAGISPAERQELDQSKLLVSEIRSRTHELRALLDKPGVQTKDAHFNRYSRYLRSEAAKLEKITAAS